MTPRPVGRAVPVMVEEVTAAVEKEDRTGLAMGISTGSMVLSVAAIGCMGCKGRTRKEREDMEEEFSVIREQLEELSGSRRRGRGMVQEWSGFQQRDGGVQTAGTAMPQWMAELFEGVYRSREGNRVVNQQRGVLDLGTLGGRDHSSGREEYWEQQCRRLVEETQVQQQRYSVVWDELMEERVEGEALRSKAVLAKLLEERREAAREFEDNEARNENRAENEQAQHYMELLQQKLGDERIDAENLRNQLQQQQRKEDADLMERSEMMEELEVKSVLIRNMTQQREWECRDQDATRYALEECRMELHEERMRNEERSMQERMKPKVPVDGQELRMQYRRESQQFQLRYGWDPRIVGEGGNSARFEVTGEQAEWLAHIRGIAAAIGRMNGEGRSEDGGESRGRLRQRALRQVPRRRDLKEQSRARPERTDVVVRPFPNLTFDDDDEYWESVERIEITDVKPEGQEGKVPEGWNSGRFVGAPPPRQSTKHIMVNLGDRSGWRHAILHAEGERWYSKGDQTRYRLEWNARKGALEVVDAGKRTYPH